LVTLKVAQLKNITAVEVLKKNDLAFFIYFIFFKVIRIFER